MTPGPNESIGGGVLRDQHGRQVLTVRDENEALTTADVKAAGTVFDAEGRQHIVILDKTGTPISEGGGGGSGTILPWATGTAYVAGQPVTNGGHTYTAVNDHTAGATFAGDSAHWTLLPTPPAIVPWAAATKYVAGQAVTYTGQTYIANDDHTSSSAFTTDQSAHWTALPGSAAWPRWTSDWQARLPFIQPTQTTYQWLRADDLAGADGSAVSSWTDLSGNARHAVQATGGNQPTLKTGQLNNRKCVRFAAGKFMLTTGLSLAPPYTVFIVCSLPDGAAFRYPWMNGAQGGLHTGSKLQLKCSQAAMPAAIGTLALYSLEFTSTGCTLRRNGITIGKATGSAATSTMTASVLGTDDDGVQTFTNYDGDFYELRIVSGTMTDSTRVGIEQAMAAYYGLPWALSTAATPPSLISVAVNGTNCSIWTPADFNPYRPTPLIIACHGASETENTIVTDQMIRYVDVATQMGFVVAASAEHGATQDLFAGTAQALADDLALYNYVVANVAPSIAKTVTLGNSYGGINSALNISRLPNVVGRIGIQPVCDTTAGPTSTNAIANPMTEPLSVYTGKRFLSIASPSDGTVAKTNHTDAFHAYIGGVARESTVITATGAHGDDSMFQSIPAAAFLARCLADV